MSNDYVNERTLNVLPRTYRKFVPALRASEDECVRCLACARRCSLPSRGVGYCKAVTNLDGELFSTAFGVIGEAGVTPIENKPIYHYRPGSRVWSVGGIGCNLRCAFCQNWDLAFQDGTQAAGLMDPNMGPEHAVKLALDHQCDAFGWTFNEPSISPMYVYESARLAREAGLFTVYVTNGLMTHEALDVLGPWLDVYRVDVKSVDPAFYQRVAATTRIENVLPIAKRAQEEFGIHVETVTNIMPGFHSADHQVRPIADKIVNVLGEKTPWHLTSFVPYAFMTHIPPTPPAMLDQARSIGKQAGLLYVYTDNFEAPETANTTCPRCERVAIERSAGQVAPHGVTQDGSCAACGFQLGITMGTQQAIAALDRSNWR